MYLDPLFVSILIGIFVGCILAFTGAGGSILAVPLLAIALHLTMAEAAPIGLLAVMLAAILGAVQGLRAGLVRYKAATIIAASGVLIAPLGVWLAHQVASEWLSLLFAAVLIWVAWRMWQQGAYAEDTLQVSPACTVNPATSKLFWTASCTRRLIATGGLAGFLSGLLGVGGGFVIVPTLRQISNLKMQSIVATTLAAVALVSATSVASYWVHQQINWAVAAPFCVATMVGMFIGRRLSCRVSSQTSQRGFAILALSMAFFMLIRRVL